MVKQWISLCLAVMMAGGFYGQQAQDGTLISREPVPGPDALEGSYSIVVDAYDWGPAVSKAVVTLDGKVSKISPEQFSVAEEKQAPEYSSADMFESRGALTIDRSPRKITAAYLCDETGAAVSGSSQYVALELAVGPNVGSPLCYHPDQRNYQWADPYRLIIELSEGSTLNSGGTTYTRLAISRIPTGIDIPKIEEFQTGRFSAYGESLQYADYSPAWDGSSHPLVVWLHGLGEGGSDPLIPLLGAKVTALIQEDFQETLGGAFVLVPQSPTFWMDDGTEHDTTTSRSRYTDTLMELIRTYVARHPDIDTDRIYLGGCSNGGYMVLSLLLDSPGYFAAAFPACPTMRSSWLSDEDIQLLKDVPIWFVHSDQDRVSNPSLTTFPIHQRLLDAGAENVRLTQFYSLSDNTGRYLDQDGHTYYYNPHYVWVRVFDNQCVYYGQSLFEWLAEQHK